nr:Ig-like domain-containing protein [Gemmatimonadaceae bacterium]
MTTLAVVVAPATLALTALGTTGALSATVNTSAGVAPSPTVSWSSSNPTVATVVATGVTTTVTAVGVGSATITATSGGQSGTAVVTVTQPAQTLTLSLSGSGAGTVTSTPAGLSCTTGSCTASFPFGTQVQLAAAPIGTDTFEAWGGACTGSSTCTVAMTAPRAVSATFRANAGVTITWPFCAATGIPLWVAVQDGAGAWRTVSSTTTDYTFTLTSGRGAVAYVYVATPAAFLGVLNSTFVATTYGTTAELVAHGRERCAGSNGGTTSHVASVVNVGTTDFVAGAMGRSVALLGTGRSRPVGFTAVQAGGPGGLTDVLLTRSSYSTPGGQLVATLNDIILRRGVPASTAPALLDFTGAEIFSPVTRTMTVNNLGTDEAYLFGNYQTANNAYGIYFALAAQTRATSLSYPALPASRQVPGDLHVLRLSARPPNDTTQTRYVYSVF